jgi:hypothetical protein
VVRQLVSLKKKGGGKVSVSISRPRVLQVVNYPLDNPTHGGQIRASEIAGLVKIHAENLVVLSVLSSGESTSLGPMLNVPSEFGSTINAQWGQSLQPYLGDITCHLWLDSSEGEKELEKALKQKSFDVILVEQPWAFKALHKWKEKACPKANIVFSSQNHEAPLKIKILKPFEDAGLLSKSDLLNLEEQVVKIEEFAVSHADEVWTITEADRQALVSEAEWKKVIIVPNGTRYKPSDSPGYENMPGFAAYIGSAYPPNLSGFVEMIGGDLLCTPPDFRVVCAGGVSSMIKTWATAQPLADHLMKKLIFLDQVSDERLREIIDRCSILLLPIVVGGGSNLKTAEALASGKSIIATSVAMRGFEQWIGSGGVHLASDQLEFRTILGRLSSAPKPPTYKRTSSSHTPLYWEHALLPILGGVIFNGIEKGQHE